jgi:hypothetical protein
MFDDQPFELVEFPLRVFISGELWRPFEVVDDGPEGAVHGVERAPEAQGLHALGFPPDACQFADGG